MFTNQYCLQNLRTHPQHLYLRNTLILCIESQENYVTIKGKTSNNAYISKSLKDCNAFRYYNKYFYKVRYAIKYNTYIDFFPFINLFYHFIKLLEGRPAYWNYYIMPINHKSYKSN